MSGILNFVQAYGRTIEVLVFGLILLAIFVNQFRLLRRVRRMSDRMTDITEKVGNYLAAVMEEEAGEDVLQAGNISQEKTHNDETEDGIISSVLQEIFP